MTQWLFKSGMLVATPGALEALAESQEDTRSLLRRHLSGDWDEVCEEDQEENMLSVEQGFRILSAYTLSNDTKVWVITEADRSVTTFLLPSEY